MRRDIRQFRQLWTLLLLAPLIGGCSGASDLMSKDAEWFSRPGRLFIRNVSIADDRETLVELSTWHGEDYGHCDFRRVVTMVDNCFAEAPVSEARPASARLPVRLSTR